MTKKTVYIDMDGVLVDLVKCIYDTYTHTLGGDDFDVGKLVDQHVDCFYNAEPIEGAVEAFHKLCEDPRFDVYILSTAPWTNVQSWTAKRVWVEKHLGEAANRRLILTHNKQLLMGDYLIDDRPNNGAAEFKGELIKFGSSKFKTWKEILKHLGI
jgi:5'(3')-deoxyribonucleotidase